MAQEQQPKRRGRFEEYPKNERIRVKEMMVILEEKALGVMSKQDALEEAKKANLDLVLISANSNPPIAKIVDYGKFRYDTKKHEREVKKTNKKLEEKIIQISYKIGEHDIDFKKKQAIEFLEKGHNIQVKMRLKGRENRFVDIGMEKIKNFITLLQDYSSINKQPSYQGSMILAELKPKKK